MSIILLQMFAEALLFVRISLYLHSLPPVAVFSRNPFGFCNAPNDTWNPFLISFNVPKMIYGQLINFHTFPEIATDQTQCSAHRSRIAFLENPSNLRSNCNIYRDIAAGTYRH